MVYEGIASGAMFSLGSGGFMAAYALALGANNLQVGILAALPFITQVVQLPAILAVERFHLSKAIGLPAWLLSNLMWLPIGAVPFLINTPGSGAVALVVGLLALRGLFAPVWLTSWTSWMRDLVPQQVMGGYYARRLAMITTAIIVAGLGGSFFVTWWEGIAAPSDAILAYSFLLIGGALVFTLAGSLFVAQAREPQMPAVPASGRSALSVLTEPLRDRNFSQLLRFLFL